jgi:predicted transglutaminase-like cysteine proteinase
MRIAAALLTCALAGCANNVQEPVSSVAIESQTQGADARLRFQTPTAEPFAFTHFCLRYADDCRVHDASSDEALASSDARWNKLAEVNDEVNHSITPHANGTRIGYDAWRIAPPSGDCNDFVITKRHELLAHGWPSRSLLLAEVVTQKGEHHLVLVARLDNQDVVLDNLTPAIRPWSETPYSWVRAQSPENPENWVTVSTSA